MVVLPVVLALASLVTASQPHIIYVLADDFGWGNADWHKQADDDERGGTPFLHSMVKTGIELDRHYSYKFCSPSRSSIQSGRNPIHVNVQNLDPMYVNEEDPVSGYTGIPRNMTGLGHVMKSAGYKTHIIGKWDVGMATPDHTPKGRGYDSALVYFHHLNDYWDERCYDTEASQGLTTCVDVPGFDDWRPVDLWKVDGDTEGAALGWNNSLGCAIDSPEYCFTSDTKPSTGNRDCPAYPPAEVVAEAGCVYEDGLFQEHVLDIVRDHDAQDPLFLFWALHVVHAPLQVPERYLDKFSDKATDDWRRQRYLAMANYMDDAVQTLVTLLQQKGMYDNTLLLFTSDNGGPVYRNGSVGANNYPLRGGKASNWEGGVRVNAFVSGGAIPPKMRGQKLEGLGTVWDWYSTFAGVAGVSTFDVRAAAAGLPPVDGYNLWPYLSGEHATSPRTSIAFGTSSCVDPSSPLGCINEWGAAPSQTLVNGLLVDEGAGGMWKLLVGVIPMDGWQGPHYPNASSNTYAPELDLKTCEPACLFRVDTDPTEHIDLAAQMPERVTRMLGTLRNRNRTTFSPDRGNTDVPGACQVAMAEYGGFWGPWKGL